MGLISLLAFVIHFSFLWLLTEIVLPCVAHCIVFSSWDHCELIPFASVLILFAFYGISGFLWVCGRYKDYLILINWTIVTAQMIALMTGYIVSGWILKDFSLWPAPIICFGILTSSFGLVIIYMLSHKKIIKTRWVNTILKLITCPGAAAGDGNEILH